jgi:hypothetical protein
MLKSKFTADTDLLTTTMMRKKQESLKDLKRPKAWKTLEKETTKR